MISKDERQVFVIFDLGKTDSARMSIEWFLQNFIDNGYTFALVPFHTRGKSGLTVNGRKYVLFAGYEHGGPYMFQTMEEAIIQGKLLFPDAEIFRSKGDQHIYFKLIRGFIPEIAEEEGNIVRMSTATGLKTR